MNQVVVVHWDQSKPAAVPEEIDHIPDNIETAVAAAKEEEESHQAVNVVVVVMRIDNIHAVVAFVLENNILVQYIAHLDPWKDIVLEHELDRTRVAMMDLAVAVELGVVDMGIDIEVEQFLQSLLLVPVENQMMLEVEVE